MSKHSDTIKIIRHLAKESDNFNSKMFSEEEGIIFGISCMTKLLGDIALSLAIIADNTMSDIKEDEDND